MVKLQIVPVILELQGVYMTPGIIVIVTHGGATALEILI